jgi:glycosyltransferase involved in cell wall biosynthesis
VVRGDEGVSDYSLPGMAFSAIVPVLNGVETIGEMLDALAEQKTSSQWEVVVADNGSSDGTRDLVRSRARDFPVPLRLIDASAVTGVAFARNAGALAASGVGIAFCDADDRVGDSWIDSILESLAVADAVGGPLRELRTPHDPAAPVLRHSVERSPVTGLPVMMGAGNFAIRRESFLSVGGLDISMTTYGGEDNELSVRLHKANIRPLLNERMVLYFRETRSLRRGLAKVYGAAQAEVGIWRRHPDLFVEENRPQWARRAMRRLPMDLLGVLRTKNPRKIARLIVRRAGNIRAQMRMPRTPVATVHIGEMAVPRDITKEE